MPKFLPNEKPGQTPTGSVLIATVYDPIKTAMIRGVLESENIPFMIRERGAGATIGIILGTNYLGTDIYVPESFYDRGMELLKPLFEDEEDADSDDGYDENEADEENDENDENEDGDETE